MLAILAALAVLAAGTGLLTGHSLLVVTSGSMSPAIATGDAIVVRSVSPGTVQVGQVVTFRDPSREQQLVTHRVTSSRQAGSLLSFTTKGDANTATEDWTVEADGRVGAFLFRLPGIGYVLAGLARPELRLALLGAAALVVGTATLRRIWRAGTADVRALAPLPARRRPSRAGRRAGAALALAAAGLLGAAAPGGTAAAFSATTGNPGDTFQAGTVVLGDNDSGTAMLALTNAVAGNSDTSCITVTSTGSLPSTVRLYGSTSGSGLDQYLTLSVTRGTTTSAFDSCAGFTVDATDYTGAGPGVVYSGTLRDFPDNYAAGLSDPTTASPESWTSGESHTYRFVVTMGSDTAARGLNASQTFTWEARNS